VQAVSSRAGPAVSEMEVAGPVFTKSQNNWGCSSGSRLSLLLVESKEPGLAEKFLVFSNLLENSKKLSVRHFIGRKPDLINVA